jgi:hypothetical protein
MNMWTPSRGVRLVGVTADMTPEIVKVGRVGARSAVGVVGLLPPQAIIETARLRATDRRFMGFDSFVFDVNFYAGRERGGLGR